MFMRITSINFYENFEFNVYENYVDLCLRKLRRLMFMKITSINVYENYVD